MAGIPTGNNVPSGGNVISTGGIPSGNNIPASAVTPVPPGAPIFWFDASNIDGTNNSSLTDGQAVGTWKNLGSLGIAANATQATAGLRPVYRASAGTLAKPALEGTALSNTAMAIPSIASQGSVITMAAMVKPKTSQAGGGFFWDGAGANRNQWGLISLQQRLFMSSAPTTGQTLTVSKWQSVGCLFNGASSFSRMDGVQSATVNVGAATVMSGVQNLMAGAGGAASFDGFVAEVLIYAGVQAPAPIESYFVSKYLATPA